MNALFLVDNPYRYNGSYLASATTSGYSSTLDNNTVLQQAQKSLDAKSKTVSNRFCSRAGPVSRPMDSRQTYHPRGGVYLGYN